MNAYKTSGLFLKEEDLTEQQIEKIKTFYDVPLFDFRTHKFLGNNHFWYKTKNGIIIPRNAYQYPNCPIHIDNVIDVLNSGKTIEIQNRRFIITNGRETEFQYRENQKEAIKFILEHKECLIEMVCGAGKTIIIARVIGILKKRAIIFVINRDLRYQTIQALKVFTTLKDEEISTDIFNKNAKVVVTTIQLFNSQSTKDFKKLFKTYSQEMGFGIVILDEAHLLIGPEKFTKTMISLNSKYLVYLTATPDRGSTKELIIFNHWLGKNRFRRCDYKIKPIVKKISYRSNLTKDEIRWIKGYGRDIIRSKYITKLKNQKKYLDLLYTLILWAYNKKLKVVLLAETRNILNQLKDYITTGNIISKDDIGLFYNYEIKVKVDAKYKEVLTSVNINKATVEELQLVKGIGLRVATGIVELRNKIGKFKKVHELLDVPGISLPLLTKTSPFFKLRGSQCKIKRVKVSNVKHVKKVINPNISDVRDKPITLGTYKKCSIGIDVPDWSVGILSTPLGNPSSVEQFAGRLLRQPPAVFFHIVDEDIPECITWFERIKLNFYDKKAFKITE